MDFSLLNIAYAAEDRVCSTIGGLAPACPPGGCGWYEFGCMLNNILNFALKITIPLGVLMIALGGFMLLTAGGDQKRVDAGRKAIIAAVVGIAIVFGSWLIYGTVYQALTAG